MDNPVVEQTVQDRAENMALRWKHSDPELIAVLRDMLGEERCKTITDEEFDALLIDFALISMGVLTCD